MDANIVKTMDGQEHIGTNNLCKMECIANPVVENVEPFCSKQKLASRVKKTHCSVPSCDSYLEKG